MVSRPRGALLDLEYDILAVVAAAQAGGDDAYGFAIARALAGGDAARDLIGHGTLYKALSRLAASGLLEATWELADDSDERRRPRRRLYRMTADGARALVSRPAPVAAPPKPALA